MQLPSGGSPEFETSTTNPETWSVGPNVFIDITTPAIILGTIVLLWWLFLIAKKIIQF